jgi:hypothetical protein
VKKGRHRRFEEARALKQVTADDRPASLEPCPECQAAPGAAHASWCLAQEDEIDDEYDDDITELDEAQGDR